MAMIEVQNLSYRYRPEQAPVVENFSARFARGEFVAVRGRNGCGKTTLGKLLVGMLRPQAGTIVLEGRDSAALDLCAIGRLVGYVMQQPACQLFCETVAEEIAFGVQNHGLPPQTAAYYLEYFGLTQLREQFPGNLSQGEQQRLMLAAVLALGTRYVLLDEPTGSLDLWRRRQLGQLLQKLQREQNCGIIVITHEDAFARRFADRELVMPG